MTNAQRLSFTKMHGLGNDFVVIDSYFQSIPMALNADLARRICDRRLGIGADQILWLKPATAQADLRMEVLNADGSEAEMCGNGIRAVALYIRRRDREPKSCYRIETLAGVKTVEIHGDQVTVDMGVPTLGTGVVQGGELLEIAGSKMPFFEINVGNPHAVFFVEDLERPWSGQTVESLGPMVEKNPRFPERTNVEFVRVESPESIRVRVWERGAGITLACGTGACASAVASLAAGRVKGRVTVHLPGGDLKVSWAGQGFPVLMEGPAQEVFSGEYFI